MEILVALDATPQSAYVLREAARLARNTWADITLLGVEAETTSKEDRFASGSDARHPLVQAMRAHRNDFLAQFEPDDSPYTETETEQALVQVRPGLWEDLKVCRSQRKRLATRIRPGHRARAILDESRESSCDLVVMGSAAVDSGEDIQRSVRKVVREAAASVLVVAEEKRPRRIIGCLDHDQVSQPSLEMINQMVTLYRADLEIVGLTKTEGLPGEVEGKMGQILKYYAANGIKALVRLVAETSLEKFAAQAARENLLALWMGRQSLLHRFFPPRRMDQLLSVADASVLVLR